VPKALISATPASASSDPNGILTKNPFRYRGYYYDEETGFYYLNARYYDPQVRRFISADDIVVLKKDFENITQYNLWAYCFNDPINMTDESGTWPTWAKKAAVVALVGVAVVLRLR